MTFFLTVNNSTFVFEGIQSCAKNVVCGLSRISDRPCGLSRISYAYLTWVAMWDRFFRQRANIGVTRSCMRWYVRKDCLTWVIKTEILIWCAIIWSSAVFKAHLSHWLMVSYCDRLIPFWVVRRQQLLQRASRSKLFPVFYPTF